MSDHLGCKRHQRDIVTTSTHLFSQGDPMKTVLLQGKVVDFEAAVELMDDEIREQLHSKIAPCTNQEFIDQYVIAHSNKFDGEKFTVN